MSPAAPSPAPAPLGAPQGNPAPGFTYVTPTTEPLSPPLAIAGVVIAVTGGILAVIGIPLAAAADETLDVCFQGSCEAVDVTDTTQRDVGLGLGVPGVVLLAGGLVMALVGDIKVEGEPVSDVAPPLASTRYLPELTVLPLGGSARWRF
jgi:hypothetical protein